VQWTRQMAQPAFGRLTPDGWSLDGSAWSSSGQLARRFEIARAIGSGANRLFATDDAAPPPRLPPPVLRDAALVATAVTPWLSAPTRAALDQAGTPREWNTYLLSSPEFNQR
jgi:hypothetical protein